MYILRLFLQETYGLVDYWAYDTLTVDKQKYSITSGSATMSYSSNGLYFKGTVATDTVIASTITVPVEYTAELDCDFNGNANYSTSIVFDNFFIAHTGSKFDVYYVSTNTRIKSVGTSISKTGTLKIRRTGTSMEIYWNDTLLDTITNITGTGATGFRTYNNRQATFKNLRIKAL